MKTLFFLLLSAGLLCGCSAYEEEVLPDPADSSRRMSVSAAEEPGPDPSSMEIMRRAVDSVAARSGLRSRSASASVSGSQIEPTHRYVRFSPSTKAQFDALFDQDEFTCYNFPLDEPSPVSAEEGFRMSAPSDTPEQLYTVLRTTVSLPDTIACEVLKELYDPSVTERGIADPAWAEQVRAMARTLADNDRHPGEVLPYTPSGEIKTWDNIADDYVPIEGVAITIMNPGDMLGALTAKTGKDGKFKATGLVRGAVNYTLTWNTADWTIKSSAMSSANLQGPSVQGAWNVQIQEGTVMLGPATVYRAAYRYWNKMPALGLSKPNLGRKVRITCHNSVNFTYYWNGRELRASGLFHPIVNNDADPDIEIGCKITTSTLIGKVAHELGHAAHYTYNPEFNGKTNALIKESWGQFTQYILTETEYKDLGLYGKLHKNQFFNPNQHLVEFQVPDGINQQNWYLSSGETGRLYTPLFVDVYDTFNQYEWYSYWAPGRSEAILSKTPNDDICIPNIREIQEIAFGSKNKSEAIGWIRQYAARYGFTSEEIDRFWEVYALIVDEDYDRYK